MSRLTSKEKIQAQWWSKTLAGVLLGLTLTYVLISMFAWYGYGGIDAPAKVQFNMWMIAPIWLTILSMTYLFKTGVKAWLYLSLANLIAYGMFYLLGELL